MIVFALMLFTSAYTTQVGIYPGVDSCAAVAMQLGASFDRPPRPFLYRLACVPLWIAAPPQVAPKSTDRYAGPEA